MLITLSALFDYVDADTFATSCELETLAFVAIMLYFSLFDLLLRFHDVAAMMPLMPRCFLRFCRVYFFRHFRCRYASCAIFSMMLIRLIFLLSCRSISSSSLHFMLFADD